MKDFRKGFFVALSALALVLTSTLALFAAPEVEPFDPRKVQFTKTGFSFALGTAITSEFGGLGSLMYQTEAAHEKVVNAVNYNMGSKGVKARYNEGKGGSLVGFIPELQVRYDITHYMFVRLGFQAGFRATGGQWDVTVVTPDAAPGINMRSVGSYQSSFEMFNQGLWNRGLDQLGNSGKSTFDYKFSSYEIPFVVGINVPVADTKVSTYAAVGLKYAWYITEKQIKYSKWATNVDGSTIIRAGQDMDGDNQVTGAEILDSAAAATLAAQERKATDWKYNLHGLTITWLIGVDAKITDQFGLYLEHEFTTQTDSATAKQNSKSAYKDAGTISSGTCRYYKAGVKYYL